MVEAGATPKPVMAPLGVQLASTLKPANQPSRLLKPISACPANQPRPRRWALWVGAAVKSTAS